MYVVLHIYVILAYCGTTHSLIIMCIIIHTVINDSMLGIIHITIVSNMYSNNYTDDYVSDITLLPERCNKKVSPAFGTLLS